VWHDPSRIDAGAYANLAGAWIRYKLHGFGCGALIEEVDRTLDVLLSGFLAGAVIGRRDRKGQERWWPLERRSGNPKIQLIDRLLGIAEAAQRLKLIEIA
jgi:hypothetical protein